MELLVRIGSLAALVIVACVGLMLLVSVVDRRPRHKKTDAAARSSDSAPTESHPGGMHDPHAN